MAAITSESYRALAAGCAKDADAAVLGNVRDRHLRAEAAWLALADRMSMREEGREKA